MSDEPKRRARDTGWQRVMQGGPMALTLLGAMIITSITYGVMHTTLADTVKKVDAQWQSLRKVRDRVTANEHSKGIILNELEHLKKEQQRLGQEVKDGQRTILMEIRRAKQ